MARVAVHCDDLTLKTSLTTELMRAGYEVGTAGTRHESPHDCDVYVAMVPTWSDLEGLGCVGAGRGRAGVVVAVRDEVRPNVPDVVFAPWPSGGDFSPVLRAMEAAEHRSASSAPSAGSLRQQAAGRPSLNMLVLSDSPEFKRKLRLSIPADVGLDGAASPPSGEELDEYLGVIVDAHYARSAPRAASDLLGTQRPCIVIHDDPSADNDSVGPGPMVRRVSMESVGAKFGSWAQWMAASLAASGTRALLVESEPASAREVRARLEAMGLSVHWMQSPKGIEGAIERVRPDVALVAALLTPVSGAEVCRRIRGSSWGASLPVVIIAPHGHGAIREAAYRAGSSSFLTRPLVRHELENVVSAHVGASRMERALTERCTTTWLLKRSLFTERWAESQRARRAVPCSLALIGMPFLAEVNARHGVAVVDAFLFRLGAALATRRTLAQNACRWAGTEIAVAGHGVPLAKMRAWLGAILTTVHRESYGIAEEAGLRCGFAESLTGGTDIEAMCERARRETVALGRL
jgi:CheY-like chemotaxis protein